MAVNRFYFCIVYPFGTCHIRAKICFGASFSINGVSLSKDFPRKRFGPFVFYQA